MMRAEATRLAAYAFSVTDGAVLLAQLSSDEPDGGLWTLPGGGLEWGEHPEDGLARELWEETGLTGTIQGLVGIDSLVLPADRVPGGRALHSLRIVYRVSCSGSPRVVEENGSVSDARWVLLSELEDLPVVDLVTFALDRARPS